MRAAPTGVDSVLVEREGGVVRLFLNRSPLNVLAVLRQTLRQGQDLLVVEQFLADYRCRRQLDATRRRDRLDDRARMRRAKAANVRWILTDERGRDPETGALRGM